MTATVRASRASPTVSESKAYWIRPVRGPAAARVATAEQTSAAEPTGAAEPISIPVPAPSKAVPAKSFGERAYPVVTVAAAVLAVVAVVLGVLRHNSSGDYRALKNGQADRDRAAQVAKEYTLRSLTYDYRNLPAFFDGVERGTSDALRDRYTQVHDTLAKIMTDAQVVATGTAAGQGLPAGTDAKTGTAEYGTSNPLKIDAWLMGFKDNVAFAVLVIDSPGNGGPTDGPIAASFLGHM